MLTIYYAPNTCALASLIALEEAGAQYTAKRLDFTKNEQRTPEFLAMNPKGRVPVLVTDKGPLTETPALLAYIAQTHPDRKLAPMSDPFAFARLQEFTTFLCSTVHVSHAHGRRAARWTDDAAAMETMKAKVPANMTAAYEVIEGWIGTPWVMGEQFTVADGYLFTITRWLEDDGVDVRKFPKVNAHFERMKTRDSVKRVLAMQSAA